MSIEPVKIDLRSGHWAQSRLAMRVRLLLTAVLVGLFAAAAHGQMLRDESLTDLGVGWSRSWIDIDGDGRDDFCFLSGFYEKDLTCRLNKVTGGVTVSFPDLWQGRYASLGGSLRWLDINGDGAVDICRAVALDSQKLVCRLGPTFVANIEVPWSLAFATGSCSIASITAEGPCLFATGVWTPQFHAGLARQGHLPGGWPYSDAAPDFHLADVNGDGTPDLCYLYRKSLNDTDLRCRIAQVNADRSSVTYLPESSAWTLTNIAAGAPGWPAGFFDFNADGIADYCRVLAGGTLRCTLSSLAGLIQTEVSSLGNVPVQWAEGAAFVDVNGDGNVDFCRLAGSLGAEYIRCTLSNGIGWEFGGAAGNTRELLSGTLNDAGHGLARWWVDINGDGLPDFCRLASSPDPMANVLTDTPGHLLCSLSRGDGVLSTTNPAFSFTEVRQDNINLGLFDGGRAFCDATGTGIATFCRATTRDSGVQAGTFCQETANGQSCYTFNAMSIGIFAGFSDSLVSARQPVLEAFSDGVGAETRITYMPLTSPQVYSRSSTAPNIDNRLQLVQPRSPVVFETRAWVLDPSTSTPPSLTGQARYLYKDLRSDYQRGSLGFRERWTFHIGANTLDHVVFFQGLGPGVDTGSIKYDPREVGAVKCQERLAVMDGLVPDLTNVQPGYLNDRNRRLSAVRTAAQAAPTGGLCSAPDTAPTAANPFVLLQATANTLGDTNPANPRLRFTQATTARSWDWNGSARIPLPTQTTTTTMSDLGNVELIDQITADGAGQQWRKLTTNDYGQDNPSIWLLGRLTRSKVKTWTPTADTQLAARAASVGGSPQAGQQQGSAQPPPAPQPMSRALLSVLLQMLLDD